MCGFCGYITKNENISNSDQIKKMNTSLIKRGPNDSNVFIQNNVAIGHTRLSIIDVANGKQPMEKIHKENKYVIAYNGELYNTNDLKKDLEEKGYNFNTTSDTEVVLTSYIEYGPNFINNLNGIFAFAIYDVSKNIVMLARDRLGIKPLFYTFTDNNTLVFASEIKAILEYDSVKRVLDKTGLMELIGLGPAHTPGKTYFKDILEIKAGNYAIYDMKNLEEITYWDLVTKESLEDEKVVIKNIHDLVIDATKKQLVSDVGISSMLSGGLDSSILTKIASDNIENLTTYSINFKGNDNDFKSNDYQLTKDSDYVKIMNKNLKTKHKNIEIENTYLFSLLDSSLIARDMPGMADIDASMFAFCKKIHEDGTKVCLSGECSDEIFGGYPWYYKEHLISHDGFPWALSEDLRNNLIKPGILKENELNSYIKNAISKTLKNVSYLENEDEYERRFRRINYLTVKWFMNTLVERTDRMSMANSLEVRVPFADHRIFEYVYNIPARMKLGLFDSPVPIEKYLLRKAFENELPEDIVYRKKSPFPKTYDPNYLKLVESKVKEIISKKDSKLSKILNFEYISNLIKSHGENLRENLFGQLMTYPQTLAYIIQIDKWLEYYNIEINI